MPLDASANQQAPRARSGSHPAIADYALIGDCRTAALVSRAGAIDWLCFPHFSAPSVFGALLDQERGGHFTVCPDDPFTLTRRYVPNTNVLETTFRTESGSARLIDLMPMPPDSGRLEPMREVLRLVEGIEGTVRFSIVVDPRPDYGRRPALRSSRGELGWAWCWGDDVLGLCSDISLAAVGPAAVRGQLAIRAGDKRCLSLCYTKGDIGCIAPIGAASHERAQKTIRWWSSWAQRCRYEGPHRDAVVRSALVLKLLTYALSGAVVAAPTTSLPEAIGGERNWDYRYCWVRDAAITMRAFTSLGYMSEAAAFLAWLLHATRLTWPRLRVLYDIYGRTNVQECELDHWRGFGNSRPVRIGNAAIAQSQLDVYGNVLFAAHNFAESGGVLQVDDARLLRGLARSIVRSWREPDHGMWEIRGEPRHYTTSKAMCWMGLHCMGELRDRFGLDAPAGMEAERQAIADAIEARAFNADLGSYVADFGGRTVDAGLLLFSTLGYVDAADPRVVGTYELIRRRLGRNGLLFRYERDYDGLPDVEGAFGLCSFWAVDHLACRGDVAGAGRAFGQVARFANDVGLFAEEIDPDSGAHLGNFPQAFTHVGLINAALAIARHARETSA